MTTASFKFRLFASVFCVSALAAGPGQAFGGSQGATGVVDFRRVLLETDAGQNARKQLSQALEREQGNLDERETAVRQLAARLPKSPREVKDLQLALRIQEQKHELQKSLQVARQNLNSQEDKMLGGFRADVLEVVKQVAVSKGLGGVVDRRQALFIGDGVVDITDEVIASLGRGEAPRR